MRDRMVAAAVSAVAIAAAAALASSNTMPTGERCGWVEEEGHLIPAACDTEEELRHRMDAVREEQTGGRFDGAAMLAECAETNGADLTVAECSDYLAWLAFAEVCEPLTGFESERCVEERSQEWGQRGN